MFFTQEDYRKIEKWLLANSVKDTEFAGASLPLKGNETVAFVQDGKNVNVFLKDLIEQIFLLGVSDFLNVTDKYGESRISLTQAIQLIPYKSRKIGQVITFLDEDGEWKLFQFQGERVNQWNNATLWVDLIKRIQGISIIDSEDITATVDNLNQTSLTFADKNYNTADYSGLGRVYLRKNIQSVVNPNTGITYSTNLLTQQMLNKENTIYVLQYDYSLNYQTISIPEGSILVFEGGDINNGTLNCNSTIIVGKFRGNATIAGTYSFQDAQADEEDITQSQSSVLKFKNKGYDEANFSGLGRTYLRKNIVNGVNVLTQDMINNPNTIYHIQYDYNLNGQTITIPSGCVLLFEGGSISNGTLSGANTTLSGAIEHVFNNLNIVGSWTNDFKLSYFTTPSISHDSFKDIQVGIRAVADTPYKFIIDIDCWGSTFVYVPSNTHIIIINTITKVAPEGGFLVFPEDSTIGGFDGVENVVIEGNGVLDQNTRNTHDVSASFIRCYHAKNIHIQGITFKDSANYHFIELGAVDTVNINKCSFLGHRYVEDPSLPEKQHRGECIQIEYTESLTDSIKRDYLECRNVSITNCLFDGIYHYEDGQRVYDTYTKSAIGCHSDTVDGISRAHHYNIVVANNTFQNIQDICINARYMDNSKFINNKAFNLKGMFIGGVFANPDLFKTYYNFDNSIIRDNEVYYDTTLTEIVEISSISNVTRKVRGAIELYGCDNTIIENNSIYNSPVHVLYIANSPNTIIRGNNFNGWNNIDKNNGTLLNNGRCLFIADEDITEGTVKYFTSNLSISNNIIRDSYTEFEVRIFYRNREPLDTTLSILGNVVEVPNGMWDLYGFSMLENTVLINNTSRPYYPIEDKGRYYMEEGKFIVWDGEVWRNSDGTWANRVVIV